MSESLLPPPTHSELDQLQAARERMALIDGIDWGTLCLTGADRAKFLHNFCTNEIKKLEPGQGCEVFLCNVKGRILAHSWVLCQPDRLLLILERDRIEFLAQHLDRYLITEAVEIRDLSDEQSILFVCGPESTESIRPLIAELPAGGPLANRLAKSMTVAYWESWTLPGWMLLGDRDELLAISHQLLKSRAVIAGDQVADYLRISAMIPRYGVDVSDDHLAQEANRTEQAISFVKGCYLGQEPIARLDALGHVNRELVGLRAECETRIENGSKVLSLDDRAELGTVSSSASISGHSEAVTLAMIKSKWTTDGTPVLIHLPDGPEIPAKVFRRD